jgi:putative ABC transport system permease protein
MPVIWRLAISNWRISRVRLILVVLVIATGTALTTAAGTLLNSLRSTLEHNLSLALNDVDINVRPAVSSIGSQIPLNILKRINAQPQVALAEGTVWTYATASFNERTATVRVVAGSWRGGSELRPLTLVTGSSSLDSPQQVVIDDALADQLGIHTGNIIALSGPDAAKQLTVSGIAATSPVAKLIQPISCYVSEDVLRTLDRNLTGWMRIDVKLQPQVSAQTFVPQLQQQLGPAFKTTVENQSRQVFSGIDFVLDRLYLLICIPTALGAGLLILAIMAVGFHDRIRAFGRLRCIGATRGQLLKLALAELALPAASGVMLGITASATGVWLISRHFPIFLGVFSLDSGTIFAALLTGLIAGAVGSAAPVAAALRATPMAALTVHARLPERRRVWPLAAAGTAALLLQIALWQISDPNRAAWLFVLVGLPLLFFSAAAFAPPLVLWSARPLARSLGRLWSVDHELLASAWSRFGWGAWALPAALLAIVAIFVFIESRGAGLLASWEFPAQFPDAVVFSTFDPLPAERVAGLDRAVPGIAESSSLTAFWIQGRIGDAPLRRLLFVAVEPQSFTDLVGMTFIEGNPQSAITELQHEPYVLLAPQAGNQLHLNAGKTVALETELGLVDFHVAGVVESQGVQIGRNYLNVGETYDRLANIALLGSVEQAKLFFGIAGVNMVLLKVKPGFDVTTVMESVKDRLSGSEAGLSLSSLLGFSNMQLQAISVIQMKQQLDQMIRRPLRAIGLVAIVLLSMGSLGAAALVAASVRNRRYEFGVLRAIGAGRGQLMRLVLAELSMIIFSAVLLGSLLGLYIAFLAVCMDQRLIGFNSQFVPAWGAIGSAAVICVGISIFSALKPAWSAASVGARALLAGGRE